MLTSPGNGGTAPSDIEILYLGLGCDGKPICVEDRVSLLRGNTEITDGTEAAALVDYINSDVSQLNIGSLDWSNSGQKLVAQSSHTELDLDGNGFPKVMLWTVPTSEGTVPTLEEKTILQQGVNGTVIVMEDSVIGRASPVWSPDDNALLYRFVWYSESGVNTCSRSTDLKSGDLRPGSIVIGVLDSGVVGDDPETIQCADEENQIGFGVGINHEWWRGGVGFTPAP